MKPQYWFKAKNYGLGWYPTTWQGWLVLCVYTAVMVEEFFRIDGASHSVSDTLLNFLPEVFVFTVILIIVCYKTGEKPRWRWGTKN